MLLEAKGQHVKKMHAPVYVCAGGEGIYRVAIDPTPKMQYLLNHERSTGFSKLQAHAVPALLSPALSTYPDGMHAEALAIGSSTSKLYSLHWLT